MNNKSIFHRHHLRSNSFFWVKVNLCGDHIQLLVLGHLLLFIILIYEIPIFFTALTQKIIVVRIRLRKRNRFPVNT